MGCSNHGFYFIICWNICWSHICFLRCWNSILIPLPFMPPRPSKYDSPPTSGEDTIPNVDCTEFIILFLFFFFLSVILLLKKYLCSFLNNSCCLEWVCIHSNSSIYILLY